MHDVLCVMDSIMTKCGREARQEVNYERVEQSRKLYNGQLLFRLEHKLSIKLTVTYILT